MKRLLLILTLGALCAQGQSLLGRYYPDPYRMPWNYHGYYPSYGYGYGGGVWTGVAATAAGAAIAIGAGEATRRLDEAAERRRSEPASKTIRYEDCQEFRGEKSRILKCVDSKGKSVSFEIPN